MSQLGDSTDPQEAVVEPSDGGAATVDFTTRALHLRIRQQEILAELGVLALQGTRFLDLLDQTARLTAEGMEAQFCKVLEYLPPKECDAPLLFVSGAVTQTSLLTSPAMCSRALNPGASIPSSLVIKILIRSPGHAPR